eukprot:Selendium_serpulae@DN5927_c0_g1_i2.p1
MRGKRRSACVAVLIATFFVAVTSAPPPEHHSHRRVPPPEATPPYHVGEEHCKPCCTAGFPALNLGYGSHAQYGLSPVEDAFLFPVGECPIKTDEAICAAAAKHFAKPYTSYGVKDYIGRDVPLGYGPQDHYGQRAGYVADPVRKHYVRAYSHFQHKAESSSRGPVIVHGKWVSDTYADLVVINNNCCFNVYADVYPGDKLNTVCENPLIGDAADLFKNFRYSLLTPGDVDAECTDNSCSFPYSVVARNWIGSSEYEVAAFDTTTGAPATQDITIFLNSIIEGTMPVDTNSAGLVSPGGDPSRRLNPMAESVAPEEVSLTLDRVAQQVCTLSSIYFALLPNGFYTLAPVVDVLTLTLDCTEFNADPCVIEVPVDELGQAEDFFLQAGSSNQVIVNIIGEGQTVFNAGFSIVPDSSVALIWNTNSEGVLIAPTAGTEMIVGNFIQPKARLVTVSDTAVPLVASFLMGNPDSMFVIRGTRVIEAPARPLAVDIPPPEITGCVCLCPQPECVEDGNIYH